MAKNAKQKQDRLIGRDQQSFSAYKQEKEERYNERRTGDDTYRIWHNRVQASYRWRQNHWNGDRNWDAAYQLYRGEHYLDPDDMEVEIAKTDNRRDTITVNVTGSSIQNMLPFLVSQPPKFVCNPELPDKVLSAKLQEKVVNNAYKKADMHRQFKRAGLDALICGHGIIEDGFTLELDESIKNASGDIVYADYIKKESPFIRRVSPYNFLIDPMAPEHDIHSARWVAKILYMPVRDILENSNHLKSTVKAIKNGEYTIQIQSQVSMPDRIDWDTEEVDDDPNTEVAMAFEIWDRKFKKYYLFADGVLPPLVEKDWPYPYLDGFPFIFIEFIPVPDCHYPMGLALAIEDQQLELNAVRTRMFIHGRRFNRKYIATPDISETELDKLIDGDDGTVVRAKRTDAVKALDDAALSNDNIQIEERIKQDIQSLTGQDALIQGGSLPSRTTAGEVNTRGNIFRMKLDDRVQSFDRALLMVGDHTLQHCKANLVTEQVVKIAGPEGNYWVEFTVDDIRDPVDMNMESVAAPKTDPQIMRQQAIQTFQIIMSSLQSIVQLQVPLNFTELFKWVFENLEIKDAGRFFAPSLTPNKPLVTEGEEVSNDLNTGGEEEGLNTELNSPQDIEKQFNLASLMNSSGLQL